MEVHEYGDWSLGVMRAGKETLVATDGIGADVQPVLFAFRDEALLGSAQLRVRPRIDPFEQFKRIGQAAWHMRVGWAADVLCVVMEGWSTRRTDVNPMDLGRLFASGDPEVRECLAAQVVTTAGESMYQILPYTYLVGRRIRWDEADGYAQDPEGAYFDIFHRVLGVDPEPVDANAVSAAIADCGFEVYSAIST